MIFISIILSLCSLQSHVVGESFESTRKNNDLYKNVYFIIKIPPINWLEKITLEFGSARYEIPSG